MKGIYALYSDPESAQRAVNSLRAATAELGIRAGDIRVYSSEPYEEQDFTTRESRTVMPWIAVLGGLVGGLAAYTLSLHDALPIYVEYRQEAPVVDHTFLCPRGKHCDPDPCVDGDREGAEQAQLVGHSSDRSGRRSHCARVSRLVGLTVFCTSCS